MNGYGVSPYAPQFGVPGPSQSLGAQAWGQPQTPAQAQQGAGSGGFRCVPVTSREEALATQVDFFGPGNVMPDLAHGMVYVKRFNPNTGASDFFDFRYSPQEQRAQPPSYDPQEDVNSLKQAVSRLQSDMDELKKAAAKRPAGKAAE